MTTSSDRQAARAHFGHLVRDLAGREGFFLFDAPPGHSHPRNAPFSWADGKVLFGWDPCDIVSVAPDTGSSSALGEYDAFTAAFEKSHAAIAAGYLSYDLGGQCEPTAASSKPAGTMPLISFAAYDRYFSFCPATGRFEMHRRGHPATQARFPHARFESEGRGARPGNCGTVRFQSDFTRGRYLAAVRQAREFIYRGDIYEVNLSQRFAAPYAGRPCELYLRLRESNPAPYSAYLCKGDTAIMSSSPELFLRLDGERVITRPIKGTAARSRVPSEDDAAAAALARSEKDNAELAMIVDLERNDLGRVCRYGTVRVSEHSRVETFARVHHLVSTIEGRLRPNISLAEIIAATFPGGSITGAPKIRAMQIIDQLEPCRREVYTGSVGYILPGGRAEFNIAIRTLLCHKGQVTFHVGGAVTADSDPRKEYAETLTKADALFAAMEVVPLSNAACLEKRSQP